ncbi:protein TonB [Inhella inkyongensis]|uniref:Protein TonB n=1 Tax=Inhella inkyongensis TaxID=392593 RepID=A0A840SB68_9BURK|nr:hypothetical protein [Inhella inkyongensis]MBB5205599.1 protein TonB [Inhella inkyongensis]
MQFSANPQQEAGSRLGGLGFVIVLHAVMIYALASGLVQRITQPPPKTDVRVVVDTPPPPVEPPRPVVRAEVPDAPRTLWTPPIAQWVEVQPANRIEADPHSHTPPRDTPAQRSAADSTPTQHLVAGLQSAGLLCPVMAQPEMPALNVSGVATFRAVGTVQGGRVVDVQLQALRALGDRRAMRTLAASVERALREGYQCSQDGQFEQEFLFRID